ncbi:uncharacterized protein BKCO1_6000201 [Diplodia corticola]|uniref:Uncharacterized protein n=1 Tax=Diplodia corticola TaxID=236234 RepID=A0A1J9SCN0_9PEZI|nr:uncharacterized protein BKCO1_6000201 [Diplodia corticola]OJD37604.1 hypothetical protein BKCO1_6000201 [Diplodia corticola]
MHTSGVTRDTTTAPPPYPHDDDEAPTWPSQPSSRVSSLDSGRRPASGPYSPVPDVSDEEEEGDDDDGRGGGYARVPVTAAAAAAAAVRESQSQGQSQRLSWMSDDFQSGDDGATGWGRQQRQQQGQQQRDSATTLGSGGGGRGDDDGVDDAEREEEKKKKNDALCEMARLSTDGGDDDAARANQPPKWMPFHLRRPFLVGFAVVWVLMIVALEVLYFVSERDGGIATVDEGLHYLWTYGPTFVLTMAAALWGQVEHSAKGIMPWTLMSRGPTVAEHGLLLNYLTSSMAGSMVRSLRRGHFAVSIGILGSLVVRLLIIFSTGLLSLEYRSVTNAKDFVFQDSPNFAKVVDYTSFSSEQFRPLSNGVNFWAILDYNLSYPHGATSKYALQSFAPSDGGDYINVTADVQVFEASLENCETFNFSYDTGGSSNTFGISWHKGVPERYWSTFEPWCYTDHSTYGTSSSVADGLLNEFMNLTQHVVRCTNSSNSLPVEEREDRVLITLDAWVSQDQSASSGIMCEPKYSLTRRTVTNVTGSTGIEDGLNVSAEVKERLDLGARPFNITRNILYSVGGEHADGIFDIQANAWYTLLNTTEPQSSLQAFSNTSLVVELSQRVFPGFAAYTIKKDFMDPSDETANGTVVFTQNRLCVQELSLRLMEALLGLLTLLSIALCFLSPGVFHRDPRSVGAHALILARSPGLIKLLSGYGASSKQALKSRLAGHTALFPQRASPEDAAITVAPQDGTRCEAECPDELEQRRWWHPMPATWWFRSSLVAAAMGIIIALEALLQASEKNDGLGDVRLDGYQKYAWTFIPTVVMAGIGLAFSMADSTARTLHPFQLLGKGQASFGELLYDPAGQVSLVAVGRAAWKRHFALLAMMLTGLLAPLLTIVTSGLYTAEPVPGVRNVTLTLHDWFDVQNRSVNIINTVDGDDGEAWTVFQLLEFSNLSYPQWTHGEYAFSSFGLDVDDSSKSSSSSSSNNNTTTTTTVADGMTIRARLPAVRANLNCSLLHYYENRNFTYADIPGGDSFIPIDPPAGCRTPPYSSNATRRQIWLTPDPAIDADGTLDRARRGEDGGAFVARLEDDYATVSLAWEDAYVGSASTSTSVGLCGDGRQHVFYGVGASGPDRLWEDFALFHCAPYVEALFVAANLSLPGLDLVVLDDSDGDPPVVPDEDSTAFLSASASATAFANADFDTFAAALVNGSVGGIGGVAHFSSLVGRANVGRAKQALESLYAVYGAQRLHFNYRRALDVDGSVPAFAPAAANESSEAGSSANAPGTMERFVGGGGGSAVLTDRTRLRLKQSAVSTRILEALVAAMALCLVVAAVLERRGGAAAAAVVFSSEASASSSSRLGGWSGGGGGRVVPKDPGSLAAKMSLFADEEVWRREVPVGAERWGDGEVVRKGVFQGCVFGLGWWGASGEDGTGGKGRFGVDVVGRADPRGST